MNTIQPFASPTSARKSGTGQLITGDILLLIDALLWIIVLWRARLGPAGMIILIPANMLLFLGGFPLAFIGLLLVLLGCAYRLIRVRSKGVKMMLTGALTTVTGILAFIVPQLIVPAGRGDTQLAWMAGITSLLVGIPLPIVGIILFFIGIVLVLRPSTKPVRTD